MLLPKNSTTCTGHVDPLQSRKMRRQMNKLGGDWSCRKLFLPKRRTSNVEIPDNTATSYSVEPGG